MGKLTETFWIFLTAREPGEGYFGGAEGAIRFVAFAFIACVVVIIWRLWP